MQYMCGVREVINAARLHMVHHDQDHIACLLDWVYYNDVMACFSLRHWSGKGPEILANPPSIYSEVSI